MIDVLLVGAGAVGQVYGRHLALAGARASVWVKPKHAAGARAGFTMYPLRSRKRREPVRFEPASVLTAVEEVQARRWEQVWLCVPTPALDGEWLGPLLDATGDATIVTLQPGLSVRERLAELARRDRIVSGAIGMVSYQAPLPGEDVPAPGVAYVFPFGTSSRFSGAPGRVEPVVSALRRGGCPARIDEDAQRFLSFSSAILVPHVVALEGENWSLAALRRGTLLPLAARASREVMRVVAAELHASPPWYATCVRGSSMRVGFTLAPHAVPFDLEQYLRYHFVKVHDQTRMMIGGYLEAAARHGLPADAIAELSARVGVTAGAGGDRTTEEAGARR